MKGPHVTVYGSMTCPDTTRTLSYLEGREVAFEFKDLDESPELNDYVASLNGGKRVMPTIRIDDHVLINPAEVDLAAAIVGGE